jgi:hypothetical protein
MTDPATIVQRLLPRVVRDVVTGCWLWTGHRGRTGYAIVRVSGRRTPAHRWFYEHFRAAIPAGRVMDHVVCSNGAGGCVNPWHVEPVSIRANALRSEGITALNASKRVCPQGHAYDHVNPAGGRECRPCRRARGRVYQARRRATVRAREQGGV